MVRLQRSFLRVGMLLLLVAQVALAGNYSDPSGYSFTHPEGWVAINRAKLGDVNQAIPPGLQAWIANNKVDLNRLNVVLLRDGRDTFLENMNVVIEPQQIPADDASVKKLTGIMTQQFGSVGAKVEGLQGSVQKVGNNTAIVVEYQIQLPGVPDLLRQKQVLFPGGGKTFIVTCTARATTFAQYAATFDQILASFQVPAPVATGFDWSRVLWTGLIGGIAGGVIGGLAWLFNRGKK